MRDYAAETVFSQLSPRERETLAGLTRGGTNAALAQRLGISQQVVKNYLHRIYDVLGVDSRLQAVLWVVNHPDFQRRLSAATTGKGR